MRGLNAALLIAFGMLLLVVVLRGGMDCIYTAMQCLNNKVAGSGAGGGGGGGGGSGGSTGTTGGRSLLA